MIELINSLIQFYPNIFSILSYAGECMNRRHLPGNFVGNPEALFRKTRAKLKKRSSTLEQEASSNQENHQNLSSGFKAMANKSIHEFSAPTTDNIHTGPATEIDGNFELMPGLINMVQSNQFCGKAHEDASAHLQHFLEICNTFTISGVPEILYYFASSHSHCY